MKCEGHTHDEDGGPVLCGSELRNVGFVRGEDGGLEERYVCDNPDCSRYRDNQSLPTKAIDNK